MDYKWLYHCHKFIDSSNLLFIIICRIGTEKAYITSIWLIKGEIIN